MVKRLGLHQISHISPAPLFSEESRESLQRYQKQLSSIQPKRILIIKPSALGDIVHALPVASMLRGRFPHAEISWIVNDTYRRLLENHPDLDEVIPLERRLIARNPVAGWRSITKFINGIRKRRFDLVIDLQGLLRTGLIAGASGARWKVGLRTAREGSRWFYNVVLPDDAWNIHAVDRYWMVARVLGAGEEAKEFRLPSLDRERNRWLAKLAGLPRPWVMMNLGTRWETKRWPVEHFATVGQHIVLTSGGSIVLVGSPDEGKLAQEFLLHWSNQVVSTVGMTTLRELAAVLSLADLVVSNDSGPLHLAAAMGKPVLAPFTCTSPVRTGPYGQPEGAVLTHVPCAASLLKRCSHMMCMRELTPIRLIPALDRLLTAWQRYSA